MATSADHQDARQNPVSHSRQAASAATVTLMPTADCSGTSGIGGQGASFGLSFGSSWTNVNCERLEKVKAVAIVLNDPATAAELLCADDEYRAARARAGQPCHSLEARAEQRAPYSGNDPIVKYRLGLP